jgi:hypothetical protein
MVKNASDVYAVNVAFPELIDTTQQVPLALAMIEQLRGGTAQRAPLPQLNVMIDSLLRGVPYLGYEMSSGFHVFRGRIDNAVDRFDTPGEFSYRPLAISREYGRCHRPGTTIFYGASNLETVLSELAPEVGDRVHVGVARVRKEQSIWMTAISEIDFVRRYGRPLIGSDNDAKQLQAILRAAGDAERVRMLLVDAFFADLFAQPASKPRDYKATSMLASLLLKARNNDTTRSLDGFAYPSVAHRGGLNFAIRPDRFDSVMEWEHFMVFEVTDYLGFGLYGQRQTTKASKVKAGHIEWEAVNEQAGSHLPPGFHGRSDHREPASRT